jgi:hypothetical protein
LNFRFDADNIVSGTSKVDQWLNGVQALGATGAQTPIAPDATAYLGSYYDNAVGYNRYPGHLIYAAYNIDYVLSATELTASGTGTSPVSPDRWILHPEGIKFLWLPGARAASGSFTGSLTNEACFWNKRLYNSSTNPAGNLVVNGDMESSLGAEWVESANAVMVREGVARSFNGSSQYLHNDASGISPGVGDFTISAMIYCTNPTKSTGNAIIELGATSGTGVLVYLTNDTGEFRFLLRDGTTLKQGVTTAAIVANTWTHVAVTFDRDGVATCYINGVANGTPEDISAAANAINTTKTNLGVSNTHTIHFQGRLANVKYWASLLTANEVAEDSNLGKGRYAAECTGTGDIPNVPDNAWTLDEASGDAAPSAGAITLTDVGSCGTAAGPNVSALAGLFDTSCMRLFNVGSTNQTATQTILAAAGTEVYASGWAAIVDCTNARFLVCSGTAGTPLRVVLVDSNNTTTTATKYSGCGTVQVGDDRISVVLQANGADGTSARFDNVDVHINKVVNGGMEGVYAKTGSALHASTGATTTYTATTVTDATAWTLTNAVVGMIAEAASGKYGFITLIEANKLTVDAWVGGTPADTEVCSVYSALAPGWSAVGAVTCARSLSVRTGTYAQELTVTGTDATKYLTQTIATVVGTWYHISGWVRTKSGTVTVGRIGITGTVPAAVSTGTTYSYRSFVFRAAGTSTVLVIFGDATIWDDLAVIPLSSVTMTATPATDANSQESNGVNQDGGDTLTIPAAGNLPAPVVLASSTGVLLANCTITLTNGSADITGSGATFIQGYLNQLVEVSDGTYYILGYAKAVSGTGVTITSTSGGSTQNWASKHASFNTSAATFNIRVLDVTSLQGTVAVKFTPRGWNGADGRNHRPFASGTGIPNSFIVGKTSSNTLLFYMYDAPSNQKYIGGAVTALTLPAETSAIVTITWNLGTLGIRLNGVALTSLTDLTGCGVYTKLVTTLYLGADANAVTQVDSTIHAVLTFDRALADSECLAVETALAQAII